jgi:putative tryptophan/tyrosine transport system substrate-binding protein
MEVRWADGHYDRVASMAAELVATKPDLLAAVGGNPVALAAKAATSNIPIVFGTGGDPVRLGLVRNFNRPEGNLTGMTLFAQELEAKRIELLHEMLPQAKTVALLTNPSNPGMASELQQAKAAAEALGFNLEILNATSSSEIERAFESMTASRFAALAVVADAFFINRRDRIVTLAAARRLPAIYPAREFAVDGGLASYGTRWAEMYRVIGAYAGRLLKGARPAELPVQRPTTYELVVNLKTAAALGLTLSPTFLARADEVIE